MLESKDYYIDLINSSKAYKFTSFYHYSGVGFRKSKINQGIYRKDTNELVGVLQWGCSAQSGIKLDRYVKEPITTDQYLELNRFCMADSEGKNSESQAIALGIKWIKMNRPDIKLLVSYAGRKEGNYGYIYQATSWEYLGYFLSEGFWLLDGEERHQITVWFKYKHHGNQSIPFTQGICELYSDVRQTTTKQFIYIKRLDKKLHCASPVLPYPKPSTDFPICTNVKVHKANADGRSIDELIAAASKKAHENQIEPHYLYEDDSRRLFGGRVLHSVKPSIAIYNENGDLEGTADTLNEACDLTGLSIMSISNATRSLKISGGYYFRHFQPYTEIPADQIETDYICIVDGIRFTKQVDLANFCGVTKQAVSIAKKRHSNTIGGYEVVWREDKKDCPEN